MISPLPPQKTGESSYTATLIEKIAAHSRVHIAAITGSEAHTLQNISGKIDTLKIWNGRSMSYPFILFRRISKLKPHIVHVQFGPHGEVYGGFFGEPMLVLLILLRLAGIRTTITSHSTWMQEQVVERVRSYRILKRASFFARFFFIIFMKLMKYGTNTIQLSTVAMNSALKKRFLEEYDFNPSTVLEIPHPCRKVEHIIDIEAALETIGLEGKRVVLLFGFIRRGKGLELAIKAMEKVSELVSNAVLLVAGMPLDSDGKSYLQEMREMSERLNLNENVIFHTKYVEEQEIPSYFSSASIILLPYQDSVGASGPAHNQAGYGVPIVASDAGLHMRETLGGNVVLFKSANHEELAKRIVGILTDDSRAKELAERIINYALKENWDLAAKRTIEYYRKTMMI